jgi:hypothetical protein
LRKKDIFFRIITWLVVLLGLDIGGGALFDPVSIFNIKKTSFFFSDIRNHAASALRASDADCVIVGTSMMSNTSSQPIREKHGLDCINVSMLGASLYERVLVLRYALKLEKYKTVILSVDYFGNYGRSNPAVDLASYEFLYDASSMNDLKFYLGFQWVTPTFHNLVWNAKEAASKDVWENFHDAVRWDSPREILRFGGINNWVIDSADRAPRAAVASLIKQLDECDNVRLQVPSYVSKFKANEEKLVKALGDLMVINKDVRFVGIVPPYSTLKRALDFKCEPDKHKRFMSEISALVTLSLELSNFTVHGFDNESFVKDLGNYKDTRHYSPYISDRIVDLALQGRNQVDETNIREYETGIERNIRDLNLAEIKSDFEGILKVNDLSNVVH